MACLGLFVGFIVCSDISGNLWQRFWNTCSCEWRALSFMRRDDMRNDNINSFLSKKRGCRTRFTDWKAENVFTSSQMGPPCHGGCLDQAVPLLLLYLPGQNKPGVFLIFFFFFFFKFCSVDLVLTLSLNSFADYRKNPDKQKKHQ